MTVIAVPVVALVIKNAKLEMRDEVRREYVSKELYASDLSAKTAETKELRSQIETLNAKMDALKITMVRLTDAVKLRDP